MSTITDEMLLSRGESWLGRLTSPSVAITVVIPINSGTSAATSEPKARIRISRVIGKDSPSALPRSDEKTLLSSLLVLTVPNWSMTSPGCLALTALMASLEGSTRFWASRSSPVSWKSTRTEWPSSETGASPLSGDTTFFTSFVKKRWAVTWSTASRNSGSVVVSVLLWIRTCSSLGLRSAL